jgi:hypothetical protein
VGALVDGDVGDGVGAVLVVLNLYVDITVVRALDGNLEGIATSADALAETVVRLDGEHAGLTLNTTLETRAVNLGVGGVSGGAVDGDGPRRALDGLALEVDGDGVLADLGGNVDDAVGAVVVVDNLGLDGALGAVDGHLPVLTSDGDVLASSIDSLDGELGGDASLGVLQTGTPSATLGGIGGTGSELSATALALVGLVITEVRDVGHGGQLISGSNHVGGVENLGDAQFLLSDVLTLGGVLEIGTANQLVQGVGEAARLEGLRKMAHSATILPRRGEILNVALWDLAAHPLEQIVLGRATSTLELLDLVTQNDGPDQTKNQLKILVSDILRTNSDELDALVLEELQAGTGVLKHLSADLGLLVVLVDGLARNDLEQVDQQQTVGQIRGKVLDLHHALEQEVVRPASEGTLLDVDPAGILRGLVVLGH